MTRYRMPVSNETFDALDLSALPAWMTITGIDREDFTRDQSWLTVEDDFAPAELEGATVCPLLRVQPDRSVIIVGRADG